MREMDLEPLTDCRIDQNYSFMNWPGISAGCWAQTHNILKGETFSGEITRWLWYNKYCSGYALADLLYCYGFSPVYLSGTQFRTFSFLCFLCFPLSPLLAITLHFLFLNLPPNPRFMNLHRYNQWLMFTDSHDQISGFTEVQGPHWQPVNV